MKKKTRPRASSGARVKAGAKPHQFLIEVPWEDVFWCGDGKVFRGLEELAHGLNKMSDEVFEFHVNAAKNDFSNWVRETVGDEELAEMLRSVNSRAGAAECVSNRIALLSSTGPDST